jgi:hypothetical protein
MAAVAAPDAALVAELLALPARIAALRSGDAAAVSAALAALAAPALALPPAATPEECASGDAWLSWAQLASEALRAAGLCEALAPLLLDERFTDAALALVVPLVTVPSHLVLSKQRKRQDGTAAQTAALQLLVAPLIRLLVRAAGDVDVSHTNAHWRPRTERVLRALLDCYMCVELNAFLRWLLDGALQTTPSDLRQALAMLIRRPPADEMDAVGAATALLSSAFTDWSDVNRVQNSALMAAVLSALPAACESNKCGLHMLGSFALGSSSFWSTQVPLSAFANVLRHSARSDHIAADFCALALAHPGALAAMGGCIRGSRSAQLLSVLHDLLRMPAAHAQGSTATLVAARQQRAALSYALSRSSLLDSELSLCTLLSPGFSAVQGAAALQAHVVAACSDVAALQLLAHPPEERVRVAAAASAAMLAVHVPQVAALLPRGTHLEALARAYCRACATSPWAMPGVPWHTATMMIRCHCHLQFALVTAASFARLTASATAAAAVEHEPNDAGGQPPAKRARTAGITPAPWLLTAADVNVRRHDSVTLLVAGEPLYVCSMLIEAASPLLADLLSGVAASAAAGGPLAPVPVPAPADVAHDAFHALVCAAVEHAYTGALPDALSDEQLLPLWCVARHLQMAALEACIVATLSPALLRAQPALMRAVAGVALRHGCGALLRAVAAALLSMRGAALREATHAALAEMAAGGGDAAALNTADALADAMAGVLRTALLARAAAAPAAARTA